MGLGKRFVCHAWVRISSSNNGLRLTHNGTEVTVSMTPGIYPLGWGSAAPPSPPDSGVLGYATFLEQLEIDIKAALGGSPFVQFGLQSYWHSMGGSVPRAATGWIWASWGTGSHEIDFAHDDTTMERDWFGVGSEVDAVSWSGAGYHQLSNYSSVLALAGDRALMEDRAIEEGARVQLVADDGAVYGATFDATRYARELRFQVDGLPEEDRDNRYNHLRRFYKALRESGCGQRFLLFRDEEAYAQGATGAWDPDAATEGQRFGWLDLVVVSSLDWNEAPAAPPSQVLWQPRSIRCAHYVAGA